MGVTLVLVYLIWILGALFVHIVVFRRYDSKKTAYWMLFIMYIPSRILLLIWGPWIAARAGKNKSDLATQ